MGMQTAARMDSHLAQPRRLPLPNPRHRTRQHRRQRQIPFHRMRLMCRAFLMRLMQQLRLRRPRRKTQVPQRLLRFLGRFPDLTPFHRNCPLASLGRHHLV
jgi:hypothetical protein